MPRGALTGSRIRERRLVLGQRQSDLAQAVGISPSYLNLIEHNRRRIGGKLLIDLARELEIEASVLREGVEKALLDSLRQAAAGHQAARSELPRIEELVARFPGWARLLAERQARVEVLEQVAERLTERMAHDPFLSASMHEILSTVTAIRSTAAILVGPEQIDAVWQARFHRNLRDDSQRLADAAQVLINYLDNSSDSTGRQSTPGEEVEAFQVARGYHMAELEAGNGDIAALVADAPELSSVPARALARGYLERYRDDAARMPLAAFAEAAQAADCAPDPLVRQFGTDPIAVFRRLASLPGALCPVSVGLVICDAAGALTFRKPVPGFALPKFGAGCALWPLYQALSRPLTPIRATLEQSGHPPLRFQSFAWCQPVASGGFDGPQIVQAAMLILPGPADQQAMAQPVGTSCCICPRTACAARREPSILADGF